MLNQIYSLIYEGKYEEASIKILKYKQNYEYPQVKLPNF